MKTPLPDPAPGLRERGKAERRARIHEAALAILQQDGLDGLTTARIAERAGLSVATLYNLVGGPEAILDSLVVQLFEGFAAGLDAPAAVGGPAPAVEGFAEATWRGIAAREEALRAVQLAIFRRSLAAGASNPLMGTVARSMDLLEAAIRGMQAAGSLAPEADARLLASQMVTCQSMLLQNWALGLATLEHCRLATRYHLLMLLRAWATAQGAAALDTALRERQDELAARVARRGATRSPRRTHTA